MAAHLSAEQIDSFDRGFSKGGDLIAVYDHISECGDCRVLLGVSANPGRSVESALSSLAVEGELEHLEYEQLEALADGTMDDIDLEAAESHLLICRFCSTELAEIRALKTGLGTQAGQYAAVPPQSISESPRRIWRLRRIAIQAAAVAAAVAVVAYVATLPLRARLSRLDAEIAELRQSNQQLQTEAQAAADLRNRIAALESAQGGSTAGAQGADLVADAAPKEPVSLRDGAGTFALDAGGNLHAPAAMAPGDEEAVKAALMTNKVAPPPLIAALAGRVSGVLRGASEGVAFALQAPVGTAVLSDRPTLRWQTLPGTTSYTAVVYDSSFNPVATSPPLTGTEWTVPQPLQRGLTYTWQVTALKDGKQFSSPTAPSPEAKFVIIDQAGANRIAAAEQSYSTSHLVLGVLFARAGLLDDAGRELGALARANPRSAAARELLASVVSLRRRAGK